MALIGICCYRHSTPMYLCQQWAFRVAAVFLAAIREAKTLYVFNKQLKTYFYVTLSIYADG